jgi:hypothetical protein
VEHPETGTARRATKARRIMRGARRGMFKRFVR